MSSHQSSREANQRRIEDGLRRINHEIGGGQITEKKIREEAARRANAAAQTATREDK